jgi:hypothetical protein
MCKLLTGYGRGESPNEENMTEFFFPFFRKKAVIFSFLFPNRDSS